MGCTGYGCCPATSVQCHSENELGIAVFSPMPPQLLTQKTTALLGPHPVAGKQENKGPG